MIIRVRNDEVAQHCLDGRVVIQYVRTRSRRDVEALFQKVRGGVRWVGRGRREGEGSRPGVRLCRRTLSSGIVDELSHAKADGQVPLVGEQ